MTVVDTKPSNSKRGRKLKYIHTLILEGINAREICKKNKLFPFNSNLTSNIENQSFGSIIEYTTALNEPIEKTTNLSEISTKKKSSNIFLEVENSSFVDYVTFGCLPDRTDLCCFHCRSTFNTSPIGVPIKYIPKRLNVSPLAGDSEIKEKGTNDFYYTYGVTCSWPCCLAFILEHSHLPFFKNSKSLLYSLYYKLYQIELKVKPAPSWECLKDYGGKMTIDEFRKSFCTCKYIITENIKRPFMVSVGKYIEEKRCGYL